MAHSRSAARARRLSRSSCRWQSYAGFPAALNAVAAAKEVFAERAPAAAGLPARLVPGHLPGVALHRVTRRPRQREKNRRPGTVVSRDLAEDLRLDGAACLQAGSAGENSGMSRSPSRHSPLSGSILTLTAIGSRI